jgi:hypothetical protein
VADPWDPVSKRLSFNQSGFRSEDDAPSDDHLRLIRLFDSVEHLMQRRTILSGGQAVVYSAGDAMVVWAIEATALALPEGQHRVENLSAGGSTVVEGELAVAARTVLKVHLASVGDQQEPASRVQVFVNQLALARFGEGQAAVRQ